ncbi:MAG: hypothetical protein JXA23_05350 [Bacteroidales bacterium]|nr:hypothetical protein [Bacteroidales bacterium]
MSFLFQADCTNQVRHETAIFMRSTILFILLIVLSSTIYSQESDYKKSPISGIWVEKEKGVDTISFLPKYDGLNPIFDLKRGYRIAEGHKLPDYFSGPYNYKTGDNNISIYWFLSSGTYQSYYFKMNPDSTEFIIGNFFKGPETKEIERDTLVFIKFE